MNGDWPGYGLYHDKITTMSTTILTTGDDTVEKKTEVTIAPHYKIDKLDWGEIEGQRVFLFSLTNKSGHQVTVTNYGATITSWVTPDKLGGKSNIVLGFESIDGYLARPPYFGATIGRYSNRIAKGRFVIGNDTYSVATNNGENHLHGGNKGFDKVIWCAKPSDDGSASVTMNYLSKDGEEGYPGNLQVAVTFTLTDDNELLIGYYAETDKATVVNLTNHSYFNLTGDVASSILDHTLQIYADNYTPVENGIPNGELKNVAGGPFDFLQPHTIGERISRVDGGYDHNFVLTRKSNGLELIATLADSVSGRTLEVYTTEPGMQLYSGNFLDGSFKTSEGKSINKHAAICLETQHFPDSPNQPSFPATLLQPGEKYETATKYRLVINK
ncbi:MAG TPA: aldose epimerase family protein [Ferruginibacter sp.]|nr:aldose epimerase family protein [Ferruginibacter sp.]